MTQLDHCVLANEILGPVLSCRSVHFKMASNFETRDFLVRAFPLEHKKLMFMFMIIMILMSWELSFTKMDYMSILLDGHTVGSATHLENFHKNRLSVKQTNITTKRLQWRNYRPFQDSRVFKFSDRLRYSNKTNSKFFLHR